MQHASLLLYILERLEYLLALCVYLVQELLHLFHTLRVIFASTECLL